jgi:hypothetical protein
MIYVYIFIYIVLIFLLSVCRIQPYLCFAGYDDFKFIDFVFLIKYVRNQDLIRIVEPWDGDVKNRRVNEFERSSQDKKSYEQSL